MSARCAGTRPALQPNQNSVRLTTRRRVSADALCETTFPRPPWRVAARGGRRSDALSTLDFSLKRDRMTALRRERRSLLRPSLLITKCRATRSSTRSGVEALTIVLRHYSIRRKLRAGAAPRARGVGWWKRYALCGAPGASRPHPAQRGGNGAESTVRNAQAREARRVARVAPPIGGRDAATLR
jgi:hypothetical protein